MRLRSVPWWLLLAVACTPAANVARPGIQDLRGLRFPPLPAGLTEESGLLLDPHSDTSYSLSIMTSSMGKAIWLSRLTYRDSIGKPHWELRRSAQVPTLTEGASLATADCSLDGTPDLRVVALGRWLSDSFQDIQRAWVADPPSERIDTVDVRRVTCAYVGDRD